MISCRRRNLSIEKWLILGGIAVVVMLLAVRNWCGDGRIRLFAGIATLVYFWIATVFQAVMLLKPKDKPSCPRRIADITLQALWVLFVLLLTLSAIKRGGVF